MNLSIIIPSIRINKWPELIESIKKSCKNYSYEIIFVGPEINHVIDEYKNIKYVRDFGHPNRCQQIGVLLSEGEYITWGSDDGLYVEDAIDSCLHEIYENKLDYLATGYNEGGNVAVNNYSIRSCYFVGKEVKPEYFIFNVAFIKREILEHEGFDTTFEVTCIGHTDLAWRIQKKYKNGKLLVKEIMNCEHMEGRSGDHGPIYDAQTFHDGPELAMKTQHGTWNSIEWNMWKYDTKPVWERRFG
jgi:hypothetical protein